MIRIMIADKHPIVRYGLKRSLAATGAFNINAEAATREELWHHMQRPCMDVLIGEMSMFGGKTFDMLAEIKKQAPSIAVVVFTMYVENCYVIEALRRGAMAYVTKAASSEELSMAIHYAVSGKQYVDSALRHRMTDQSWEIAPGEPQALSPRESEVRGLIVDGKRNGEIAELLNVSEKTVSTHRTRILQKMNLTTNQQIVRHVLQQRLQSSH
jgi:DNA-binding NarL/FixJ family response regulator